MSDNSFDARVLHVLNNLSQGGAEAFVFGLVSACPSFSVFSLSLSDDVAHCERVEKLNSNTVRHYQGGRGGVLSFARALKESRAKVVHCHNLKSLVLATLTVFLFRFRVKLVFTQHTSYLKRKFLHKFLQIFVSRYVAICGVAMDDFCEVVPRDKVVKLMNGVEQSNRGDDSLRVLGKCNVGMIARFHKVKNHKMLIDAATILKDRGELNSFRFFLIGDGEERGNIERLVQERGLGGAVSFLGALSDARNYLDSFDYLLLCSTNEGLPISVLESLEKRTPVIATDVGGVSDLIIDGVNGYLVSSDDPEDLVETLVKAADSSSIEKFLLYFSENKFMYSMDEVLKKHIEVYEGVLSEER